MGKAILAHVSDQRRDQILRRALGPRAAKVADELADELTLVASDGFARDEEVFAVGQRCVAAPLLAPGGEAQGAISVAGPSSRFTREVADGCVATLLDGVRRASIGGAR
jgi:DNA-binding IclR family transcriptional regulator